MEGQGKPSFKGLSSRLTLDTTSIPYKPTHTDKLRGFYSRGNAAPSGAYVPYGSKVTPVEAKSEYEAARQRLMQRRGWM